MEPKNRLLWAADSSRRSVRVPGPKCTACFVASGKQWKNRSKPDFSAGNEMTGKTIQSHGIAIHNGHASVNSACPALAGESLW